MQGVFVHHRHSRFHHHIAAGADYCSSCKRRPCVQAGKYSEEALEKERDALAKALERLAAVQRELATGQHELMAGQKALAEQQDKLVQFLESPFEEEGDDGEGPSTSSPDASSAMQNFGDSPGARKR